MNAIEQMEMEAAATRELWSVTNALDKGLGAPEGIVYWNCEQTAIAAIDRQETLAVMLREGTRKDAIKWLVQARWTASERAKQRGTDVHRAAESIALGTPRPLLEPDVAAEIEPYVEQLVRWLNTWNPKFVMAEAPVYNLTFGYAGTCDGIFEINGKRYLFDYKTTDKLPTARSRPPYSNAALQMAAYAHAELVGLLADRRYSEKGDRYYIYDPQAEHEPMPQVDGALCIVISPVDCFAVPTSVGRIPWESFQHALALAAWNSPSGSKQQALYVNAFGPQWIAKAE